MAIVGETGAGKTTMAYLVARLYDVERGRVSIDGHDVRDVTFASLARTVGVVSQETYLFHDTVHENLRFARPDATDAEIEEAARAARIHDLVSSLPDGYDTVVGECATVFSGGEKQRIAIARTILRNPPVLVLDEATSALDTQTERAVQEALDRLAEGLERAAYFYAGLALLATGAAWLWMDNLSAVTSSPREQMQVVKQRQTWLLSVLYIGTFGSFIGYSAAMPLLIRLNFWVPEPSPLGTGIYFAFYAFLGAGVGSLTRPLGGWLADKWGGARVTLGAFVAMTVFTVGVLWTVGQLTTNPTADPAIATQNADWFPLFLGFFLCIFAATGIGNGSVYKMIPSLWKAKAERATSPGTPERAAALTSATRQASAALGVIGAVGAMGGFLVPLAFSAPWVADPLSSTKGAFAVFAG